MDDIPESISCLSNEELRKQLINIGIQPAPLTPTTRRIFQRKLARKLGISALTQPAVQQLACGDQCVKAASPKFKPALQKRDLNNQDLPLEPHISDLEIPITFYAVQGSKIQGPQIFANKEDALKFLKQHHGARLKAFPNQKAAKTFSTSTEGTKSPTSGSTAVIEKANEFKMPKQQDLNRLSKAVASGNETEFDSLVWKNPRYLINSADAPVVLKPAARYNALHVASRENQPSIVRRILSTLQDPAFQQLMYGKTQCPDTSQSDDEMDRVHHIVDLYLNTPDKTVCETPLHFACKLGHVDVVSELISHPLCCKSQRNKEGKTPEEIACTRSGTSQARSEIKSLLREQFYVSLLRGHDNSQQPIVAPPWTPNRTEKEYRNLFTSCAPQDPIPVVSAVAGPMSSEEAHRLQHAWMTPNRKQLDGKRMSHIRRSDMDRGDERIGRELAQKADVPWMEYWKFLENYVDFSTEDGLGQLERYLIQRFEEQLSQLSQDHSAVFYAADDSLTELCSNFNEMKVNDDQAAATPPRSVQIREEQSPSVTSSGEWWSSTPRRQNVRKSEQRADRSLKERHLELLRENLIKARQTQLARIQPTSSDNNINSVDRASVSLSTPNKRFPEHLDVRDISDKGNMFNQEMKFSKDSVSENLTSLLSSSASDSNSSRQLIDTSPLTYKTSRSDVYERAPLNESPGHTKVFLNGSSPTKLDRDVLLAIGNSEVSAEKYPYVWKWIKEILSYSAEDRNRWKTPTRPAIPSDQSSFQTWRHSTVASPWPASPLSQPRWKDSTKSSIHMSTL